MNAQDFLRQVRAYGLTQVQVAERTGIPQSTISKIERGAVRDVLARNYIALETLLKQLKRKRKPMEA